MEVLFLTTLFSVLFAILFLLFFLRARQKSESCAQQDALLPFRDDPPAPRDTGPRSDAPSDPDPSQTRHDQ